jgi:DNA adenine methylase
LFSVPWGKYKDPLICDSTNLRNVGLALNDSNTIIIQLGDYKKILLGNAKEGDFIYLDPPYNPVSSTAYFTKYTNNGFSYKDQEELATVFRKLDNRRCKVLLSNSDTQFIRELLRFC